MAEENIGGEEGIIEERRKKLQLLRDKNTAYINDFLKEHYAHDLHGQYDDCLLYTSPSPRDRQKSRMPSSA